MGSGPWGMFLLPSPPGGPADKKEATHLTTGLLSRRPGLGNLFRIPPSMALGSGSNRGGNWRTWYWIPRGSVTGEEIYSLNEGLKNSQGLCRIDTPHVHKSGIKQPETRMKRKSSHKWFWAKLLRSIQVCHRSWDRRTKSRNWVTTKQYSNHNVISEKSR